MKVNLNSDTRVMKDRKDLDMRVYGMCVCGEAKSEEYRRLTRNGAKGVKKIQSRLTWPKDVSSKTTQELYI